MDKPTQETLETILNAVVILHQMVSDLNLASAAMLTILQRDPAFSAQYDRLRQDETQGAFAHALNNQRKAILGALELVRHYSAS